MSVTIKTLLVDRYLLSLTKFISRLEKDPAIELLVEQGDEKSLGEIIGKYRPDIVVYDFSNAERRGVTQLKTITGSYPQTRAITLTDRTEFIYVSAFFRYGGWGYVLKSAHEDELHAAIHTVACGEEYYRRHWGARIFGAFYTEIKPEKLDKLKTLPPRHYEIIPDCAEGRSLQEISENHLLGEGTAEQYRQKIMTLLGAHKQAELRLMLMMIMDMES